MTVLERLGQQPRAAGHQAVRGFDGPTSRIVEVTGWWARVDGVVVARGQAVGEVGEGLGRWTQTRERE